MEASSEFGQVVRGHESQVCTLRYLATLTTDSAMDPYDVLYNFVYYPFSTTDLYTLNTLKFHLNTYLTSQNLVNLADQSYINIGASAILTSTLSTKGSAPPEFMKREELIKAICDKMQNWYRIGSGEEAVVKYVLRHFCHFPHVLRPCLLDGSCWVTDLLPIVFLVRVTWRGVWRAGKANLKRSP